jgi:hypothetical protein
MRDGGEGPGTVDAEGGGGSQEGGGRRGTRGVSGSVAAGSGGAMDEPHPRDSTSLDHG